jgi:hypothetical protein
MHEPTIRALSKALSPVKWRRAFPEAMTDKPRMGQQTSSWMVMTAVALAAVATMLFVFVALP